MSGFYRYSKEKDGYIPMPVELLASEGEEYTAPKLTDMFNKHKSSLDNTKNRADELFINVKDFGAKGDGVNDDFPAIQEALNKAKENKRTRIFIPNGTYNLSCTLVIYRNTHLLMSEDTLLCKMHTNDIIRNFDIDEPLSGFEGHGNITIDGGTLWGNYFLNAPDGYSLVTLIHAKNIKIRNVVFKDTAFGHALEINSSKDVVVEDCKFEGWIDTTSNKSRFYCEAIQLDYAIPDAYENASLNQSDYTHCENITVERCWFGNSDTPGMSPWACAIGSHTSKHNLYCKNIKVINCIFEELSYWPVHVFKWRNYLIKDCISINSRGLVYVRNPNIGSVHTEDINGNQMNATQPNKYGVISGNICDSPTSYPLYFIGDQDASNVRITISDNIAINLKTSYKAIDMTYCDQISIVNNNFSSPSSAISLKNSNFAKIMNNELEGGISVDSDCIAVSIESNSIKFANYQGIFVNNSRHVLISTNDIHSPSQIQEGAYDGVFVGGGSDYVRLFFNKIYYGNGLKRNRYGFNITGSVTNCTRLGNDVRCNSIIANILDNSIKSNTSINDIS